jgi:hypothetical protein
MKERGSGWWRPLAWWLCVALWTIGLLSTTPAHVNRQLFPTSVGFSVSKTVHVAVYAFLCTLIPFLGVRRWPLLVFLSLHACATEYVQQWVPERTGSLRDVGLDHLGLLLGLTLSWRWWLRAGPASRSSLFARPEKPVSAAPAVATESARE